MDAAVIAQLLQRFFTQLYYIHQSQPGKPLWKSKRFYTFVLGVVAVGLQMIESRWIFDPGIQMIVLVVINFAVGLLSKSPTGFAWEPDNPDKNPDKLSGLKG